MLLFGAENWFMSPRISKTIGGFHHRVAFRLAWMRPRWDTTVRWVYPLLDAVMAQWFWRICRRTSSAPRIP